jgi:hypothetical protein
VYVLDLFTEFRCLTNGSPTPCGVGLLGALAYFGIDGIDVAEKDEMRALALRGGPWTTHECQELLAYCATDVVALAKLLPAMISRISVPYALLRGRYMKAAAHMEWNGIPLDTAKLHTLRLKWGDIQGELIRCVDQDFGIYEGRTFKAERFQQWLTRQGIAWPRLPSGALALDADTFREMARVHTTVNPIKELRSTLSQMRLEQLAVGSDNRNRTLLSAFRAKTSRNQPSNTRSIFGPAVWLRHLIRPEPGYGLAYIDWSQQEFAIAGVLSGDQAMMNAYYSGDPYLAFAKQAGAVPSDATKVTHSTVRDRFKACVLAVQYGMGAESLSYRIGQTPAHAQALLDVHRRTYPRFWTWSDSIVDYAALYGQLYTVFGWTLQTLTMENPRSLRNFPVQSNGAEMLRLACCFATEHDIHICAPVHDAVLIEAPLEDLDDTVVEMQRYMAEASAAVLDGFQLRSEAKVFRYPEHYQDERGKHMWDIIWSIVGESSLKGQKVA